MADQVQYGAGVPISFNDADSWDDSLIMEIFHSAIRTHGGQGSRAGGKKRAHFSEETSGGDGGGGKMRKYAASARAGIPGQWHSSPSSPAAPPPSSEHTPALPCDVFFSGLSHTAPPAHVPHIHAGTGMGLGAADALEVVEAAHAEMLQAWFAAGVATGRWQGAKERADGGRR